MCNGHPDSWLEDISINNFKLYLSHDPSAPYHKSVNALSFKQVKNLKLKDVEVIFTGPAYENWESALYLESIDGLLLDGFTATNAPEKPGIPVIREKQVSNSVIRDYLQ
ncbi:MAG: hypothetical protein WC865_17600 [Bacteroidales bacterium]